MVAMAVNMAKPASDTVVSVKVALVIKVDLANKLGSLMANNSGPRMVNNRTANLDANAFEHFDTVLIFSKMSTQ